MLNRPIAGKQILFILALAVAGCTVGLVVWTHYTPRVNSTVPLQHPVPGVF